MPRFARLAALLMLAGLAAGTTGCRNQPRGSVRVVVIGSQQPKLRDPVLEPLSPADAVLLANVAQGLVRLDSSGNIVAGLAERWNVSDDGLSYIFRIASAKWPDGRKITAQQVARILKRALGSRSKDPLKDALGAVGDIVAMTDRVIEIRLIAPRPNLLPLLAQPEFAIVRDGQGTGPFHVTSAEGELRLRRDVLSDDEDVREHEEVLLAAAAAPQAVADFVAGKSDLVLGGSFADLPLARRARLPRNSLRFDPASGLFGLVPGQADGPLASGDARALLSQAIDRPALIAALNVPGLAARATVLEPGIEGTGIPAQPAWLTAPVSDRRAALTTAAARLFKGSPVIRLWLGAGAGADILFNRLATDWGPLGLNVQRAVSPASADLMLVDRVAPSNSAAWFVRSFRCGAVAACDAEVDKLLEAAREAPVPAQRYALLAQAAARIDSSHLFIPFAAPIRWSLVSTRIQGFAGNRYASHTLTNLEQSDVSGG